MLFHGPATDVAQPLMLSDARSPARRFPRQRQRCGQPRIPMQALVLPGVSAFLRPEPVALFMRLSASQLDWRIEFAMDCGRLGFKLPLQRWPGSTNPHLRRNSADRRFVNATFQNDLQGVGGRLPRLVAAGIERVSSVSLISASLIGLPTEWAAGAGGLECMTAKKATGRLRVRPTARRCRACGGG
jgi:hypothetical protein